jgi:hypothetical protein
MKRRLFVKTSLLGTVAGTAAPFISKASGTVANKNDRQWYELRVYTFKNSAQETITENYFEKAAIPALNRLGCKNVGVFKEMKPGDQPKLFVVIPFESIEQFTQAPDKLAKDILYKDAAAAYLNATAAEPAYERIESSLLRAFTHMPLLVPFKGKPRIFELRRYESASEKAGEKKIDMFNDKGEIAIFKRTGLAPVFFGETIIGTLRPNLTYMLMFEDMAAHDANWKVFGSDPEWKKIKAVPGYADAEIVSHITSTFLLPADCSQV